MVAQKGLILPIVFPTIFYIMVISLRLLKQGFQIYVFMLYKKGMQGNVNENWVFKFAMVSAHPPHPYPL